MNGSSMSGFGEPVDDAQRTFRALLEALAHPGTPHTIATGTHGPAGIATSLAAAMLALFDSETCVWRDISDEALSAWLTFHTECRFAADPAMADFALVADGERLPSLALFDAGTAEDPERSATIFVQVSKLDGGTPVILRGPGIESTVGIAPGPLAPEFWPDWERNAARFPLGVDAFFFAGDRVIGLPRTARVKAGGR